jgi:hypothetical protein
MWVATAIQYLVTGTRLSCCGRALWVRLSGIPEGNINTINIYASTEATVRIELWEELIRVLPMQVNYVG